MRSSLRVTLPSNGPMRLGPMTLISFMKFNAGWKTLLRFWASPSTRLSTNWLTLNTLVFKRTETLYGSTTARHLSRHYP